MIIPPKPHDPDEHDPARYSRRAALGLGGAAIGLGGAAVAAASLPDVAEASGHQSVHRAARSQAATAITSDVPTTLDLLRPDILPRDAWGQDLPITGEILAEEDVRFLLVHHTASSNDYRQDQVADQIRSFYQLHTGPEKGWPDVAYNFFVDRFGGIWEARAGSIDGPVRGDATGGSQGFALLCSLIGNHTDTEVTPEALDSLTTLLAWLGERYDVDTTPGTLIDFSSRGSNRWPEGTTVTTPTISGHRDMSQTTCPGDATYKLLAEDVPARVTAIRLDAVALQDQLAAAATSTATSQAPSTSQADPDVTEPASASADSSAPASTDDQQALGPGDGESDITAFAVMLGAAATFGAVLFAGAAKFRRRTDG